MSLFRQEIFVVKEKFKHYKKWQFWDMHAPLKKILPYEGNNSQPKNQHNV